MYGNLFQSGFSHNLRIPILDNNDKSSFSLEGTLFLPDKAKVLVVFVDVGYGRNLESRRSDLADRFHKLGLATFLIDLLRDEEATADLLTKQYRFNFPLLSRRLHQVIRWIEREEICQGIPIGLLASHTGAAAAVAVAAERPKTVSAIVSRTGRPDLAPDETLSKLLAPILLLVGEFDQEILEANQSAFKKLTHSQASRLSIVPGTLALLKDEDALAYVATSASRWLLDHSHWAEGQVSGTRL